MEEEEEEEESSVFMMNRSGGTEYTWRQNHVKGESLILEEETKP